MLRQTVLPTQRLHPSTLYVAYPFSFCLLYLSAFTMSDYSRQLRRSQNFVVPFSRKISHAEKREIDWARGLREKRHEGPDYAVIDASASTAKKGSAARANFDPFTGMPSYSGRYQKKHRTFPKIPGREEFGRMCLDILLLSHVPTVLTQFQIIDTKYFPRQLWPIIQPNYRPDALGDEFKPQAAITVNRGFEDEEDEAEDDAAKRRAAGGEEKEAEVEADEGELLEGDEDAEEEIVDDDFEEDEDEMGGDYNAEQYFDAGDDEFGEDGFGDGGGGGDEDTY